MRPRTEVAIAAGIAALVMTLAYAGGRRAHSGDDPDRRASSFVRGREGTSAMADVADRLGVRVVRWRQRPQGMADGLAGDMGSASPEAAVTIGTFVLLDPSRPVTPAERDAIVRLASARRGADLVLAGSEVTELAQCFGYRVAGGFLDSARVVAPGASVRADDAFVHDHLVPVVRRGPDRRRTDTTAAPIERPESGCPGAAVTATDTLLLTTRGALAMVRLTVSPFGRSVVLAGDVALLRNRTLRATATGAEVLQSVLPRHGALVIDEYHQGFSEGGSMAGAVLAWSRRNPLGWMAWQLFVVGLIALAAGAVRFGPVRAAIVRQRRSPLEHVRALATALAAAGGHRTAVAAMVRGLRRRLSHDAAHASRRDDWRGWLASLRRRAPNPHVQASAERLERVVDHPETETAVLSAANAVEDLWDALRP